jgi:hypothetical protein
MKLLISIFILFVLAASLKAQKTNPELNETLL